VATTNMSTAAILRMWLRRKLRQVGEGTLGRHGRPLDAEARQPQVPGRETRAERLVIMPATVYGGDAKISSFLRDSEFRVGTPWACRSADRITPSDLPEALDERLDLLVQISDDR
jgi:hypothetical protein